MSSLQEFTEWAVAQKVVSNPTSVKSSQYPGQCVSLIQQYLKRVFGVPYAPRGHAAWFVPPHFKRVTGRPKPGDIIRYGRPYGVVAGVFYGHIGMIDHTGGYMDQNGIKLHAVGRRKTPYPGIESVWRPTKKFKVRKTTSTTVARIKKAGTATVKVPRLNVRSVPKVTPTSVVTDYSKGQTFNYDSYVKINGYLWLSYVSHSGKRRYVAQRPLHSTTSYVSGGIK